MPPEIVTKSNDFASLSFSKGYCKKPNFMQLWKGKSMVWHMDASLTLFVVQKMNSYWFIFRGKGSALGCVRAREKLLVAQTATTEPD